MKVFSEKDKRGTSKNVVHDDVFANVFNRVVDVKGRHPRFHAFLTRQAMCARRIAASPCACQRRRCFSSSLAASWSLLASSLDQQDRRSAVENRVQRSLLHWCYSVLLLLFSASLFWRTAFLTRWVSSSKRVITSGLSRSYVISRAKSVSGSSLCAAAASLPPPPRYLRCHAHSLGSQIVAHGICTYWSNLQQSATTTKARE